MENGKWRNSRKDSDIVIFPFSILNYCTGDNNEQDYKNCGRIRCRTAERGQIHLTNKLVGQKVAYRIDEAADHAHAHHGVLSRGETQYVLLDTPGLHKPRSRLGDYMCKVVTDTVSEVDVAVLVVEPIPNIVLQESLIAQIKQHHMPGDPRHQQD